MGSDGHTAAADLLCLFWFFWKIAYILVKIETNMKGAEAAAAAATAKPLQHTLSEDFYDDIMRGVSYYHHTFDKLIDF